MRFVSTVVAILALITSSSAAVGGEGLPTATELLDSSIAFHDPEGLWGKQELDFVFEETRPDGSVRKTEITIDIAGERFRWATTSGTHRLAGELDGSECVTRLDGRTDLSDAERKDHRLTCDRLAWIRDYYTYLWGLPMKLRDPGTRLGEQVVATDFQGSKALALKVTYDEQVGTDTWYFYFDSENSALLGYRFFHDESQNDGEYIALAGIKATEALRLPRTRAWYYNKNDGYLGTDTLVSLERARNDPDREP